MSELSGYGGSGPVSHLPRTSAAPQPANLADLLERVLDKGIVIAGDIRINLLDIELLTIRIRLLIASVDRARDMGIDWWEHDPSLSSGRRDLALENRRLRERIGRLEAARSAPAAPEASEGYDDPAEPPDHDTPPARTTPRTRRSPRTGLP
ncbi:gas vesicle protein GvpJ [Kitasatospora sp. NPDC008115]|uniref:gas vesicle protein GvpJ n=1 Tax=Kitasatospora sp. NPDC008115 TaxID=3364022 RepID=UPI0036E58BBE